MPGQNRPQRTPQRPPRQTPAERSAKFDAEQARLKADAAERRAAAARSSDGPDDKRKG